MSSQLAIQLEPDEASATLVLAMRQMGFNHTKTTRGFVSDAYEFAKDDTKVTILLPLIDLTAGPIHSKVDEVRATLEQL